MIAMRTLHTITARAALLATVTMVLLAPAMAGAQDGSLARRIAAVGDGEARFSYPTRAGVCGDGRKVIGFGRLFSVHPDIEGWGRWSSAKCEPGPARVAVTVRGGEAVAMRPYVGGTWDVTTGVRDLGTVSGADAAAYLMDLAVAKDGIGKSALLPAAIADAPGTWERMLAIGRRTDLGLKTRRRAIDLAGATGDASTVPSLVAIATAGEWDGKKRSSDDGVSAAAIGALATIPGGAGTDALLRLAKDSDARVRKQTVFWLGQGDDVRGRRAARAMAEDTNEDVEVRAHAIFAIGMGDESTAEDRAWLRGLYPRLTSEKLRERVLMSAGQQGGPEDHRWLLERAADTKETTHARRQAVFWAGQGGVPIADLVSLYGRLDDGQVKEHVIFALSQRSETAATDALLAMAQKDPDRAMRKKALFWLTQKDDPRVTKLITDMVSQ